MGLRTDVAGLRTDVVGAGDKIVRFGVDAIVGSPEVDEQVTEVGDILASVESSGCGRSR